jgi:hypothetical protein
VTATKKCRNFEDPSYLSANSYCKLYKQRCPFFGWDVIAFLVNTHQLKLQQRIALIESEVYLHNQKEDWE